MFMKQPLWSHALNFVVIVLCAPIVLIFAILAFALFMGAIGFPFLRWLGFPVHGYVGLH
jgi:hypothetical protein